SATIGILFSVPLGGLPAKSTTVTDSSSCQILVNVQSQSGAPVLIAPMKCYQVDSQTANIQFTVVNLSDKPITAYTIGGEQEYTDYKQAKGDKMSTERRYGGGRSLLPGWSDESFLGGGVITKTGGIAVGPLTRFTLFVESVVFADGTEWAQPK
ncbi:MAG TPA: hypothetical protein VFM05_14860, partial [Candidatus Saccharimonadales bacterium]|nr:hypothetical protein [Candidatus Saccharimonadales bacterium]